VRGPIVGLVILLAATGSLLLPLESQPAFAGCRSPRLWGDVVNVGDYPSPTVNDGDAWLLLRDVAGLPNPLIYCGGQDIDCDGDVDVVDVLKILRYAAGLPYSQHQPCPAIGQQY